MIRDWTERNFEFAGYVTGFDPRSLGDRDELRHDLGYRPDEKVCIVSVGGSGVGGHLLRRVIASFDDAKRRVPELRMIVVAGPRIDPELAAAARRPRGRRLRPQPLPPPRRLRPRGRAGRPHHRDGADREPAAVPLLPAAPPLRAEHARRPPARPLRRRPADGLRHRRARTSSPRRSPRRSAAPSTTARSRPTAPAAPRRSWPSCSSCAANSSMHSNVSFIPLHLLSRTRVRLLQRGRSGSRPRLGKPTPRAARSRRSVRRSEGHIGPLRSLLPAGPKRVPILRRDRIVERLLNGIRVLRCPVRANPSR